MKTVLLSTLLAVLVGVTSARPQSSRNADALKQATRADVVQRISRAHAGINRRQSLPSNGVYPFCSGDNPSGTTTYAVFAATASQAAVS